MSLFFVHFVTSWFKIIRFINHKGTKGTKEKIYSAGCTAE
jgi:hypothetical protein